MQFWRCPLPRSLEVARPSRNKSSLLNSVQLYSPPSDIGSGFWETWSQWCDFRGKPISESIPPQSDCQPLCSRNCAVEKGAASMSIYRKHGSKGHTPKKWPTCQCWWWGLPLMNLPLSCWLFSGNAFQCYLQFCDIGAFSRTLKVVSGVHTLPDHTFLWGYLRALPNHCIIHRRWWWGSSQDIECFWIYQNSARSSGWPERDPDHQALQYENRVEPCVPACVVWTGLPMYACVGQGKTPGGKVEEQIS